MPGAPVPGIYNWHFLDSPGAGLEAGRLLYIGISPQRMRSRASTQDMRKRIRYHFRGNAAGSTLRLTLGCAPTCRSTSTRTGATRSTRT